MRLGEKNLSAEILCLDLMLVICNSTFGLTWSSSLNSEFSVNTMRKKIILNYLDAT